MITRVDTATLEARAAATRRLIRALDGIAPAASLAPALATIERVEQRLALPRDHVVLALAGTTGSGKSSIFNALAGMELSTVGVRRPTTSSAHACVWEPHSAGALLDWFGVPANRRFDREPGQLGDDTGDSGEPDPLAKLSGLILLDLPDFDSVETAHRAEVDRMLRVVDQVVWVLDPQKYADDLVHERYLRPAAPHGRITTVVLNKTDTLDPSDTVRCVADLRRLLDQDGLSGVGPLATSTITPGALDELRSSILRAAANGDVVTRLAADLAIAVAPLVPLVSADLGEDVADRDSVSRLIDLLAVVAGVPAMVEGAERDYRRRADSATSWPIARIALRTAGRLRRDPLGGASSGSGSGGSGSGSGASSGSPEPQESQKRQATAAHHAVATARHAETTAAHHAEATAHHAEATARHAETTAAHHAEATAEEAEEATAQRVAATLAARELVDRSAASLPDPWPAAASVAARAREGEIPAALETAVERVVLQPAVDPSWWRAVRAAHWVAAACVIGAAGWLATGYLLSVTGAARLPAPAVGRVPVATALLVIAAAFGLLLAVAVRPLVRFSAGRTRRRAKRRLRAAVAEVASNLIVAPLRGVLREYRDARAAFKETQRDSAPERDGYLHNALRP